MASPLERTRIAATAPDAVLHDVAELGFYELLESGMSHDELDLELTSRAAAAMGVGKGGSASPAGMGRARESTGRTDGAHSGSQIAVIPTLLFQPDPP